MTRALRVTLALLGGALVLVAARRAEAYPEYIAKGYTNCVTCHYSVTGGGLPNSYGRAAIETTWAPEALVNALEKNDVTGRDDAGSPVLQWDAGLDIRLLGGFVVPEPVFIPMLLEAGPIFPDAEMQ